MNLAIKLRELRKEKGFTQSELAKTTGLATSCISMIEIGQREANAHTIFALAKALNVTSDYLLGLEDDFGNVQRSSTPGLTADEQQLLKNFALLGPFERETILIQINALAKEKGVIKK